MNEFGIDLSALDAAEVIVPDVIPGRVLQLDGDMLCYECCFDDETPMSQCIANFTAALQVRMAVSASEFCTIHLTGEDKGGRFQVAKVKQYQANRLNKVRPANLGAIRAYVQQHYALVNGNNAVAVLHENQEADDGMATAQYQAFQGSLSNPLLSVIMSGDKDLTMCSGWHCDWWSYEMTYVEGFGSCRLDDSGSTKKVKGFGTSFFWHQLLMGDTADNIPGLPMLGPDMVNKFKPTKASIAALAALADRTESAAKRAKAEATLAGRTAKIGPALAYEVLQDCRTDAQCFLRCVEAYQSHYGKDVFDVIAWDGTVFQAKSGAMLLEQAQLLWMRRKKDECPREFFKQVMHGENWIGKRSEGAAA
jgi:hypothetical protein